MQEQPKEEAQAPLQNSMSSSLSYNHNLLLSNSENLYYSCHNILARSHQSRSASEVLTLLKLMERSQVLRQLGDMFGLQFVKGILRNAKIEIINDKQVLIQEGNQLKNLVIVLQGNLAVQKQKNNKDRNQKQKNDIVNLSLDEAFERLTILAQRQRDLQRKLFKIKKKHYVPKSQYKWTLPVLIQTDFQASLQNVERNVGSNDYYGGKQRLTGKINNNRIFTLQRTTLLVFQLNFIFYWLEMAFKSKLSKNIQKMKTIAIFQILQQQKLSEIILSMKERRLKKHDILYSQGQDSQHLYILIEGELKISKYADLFRENPNDLYTDRRRLIQYMNEDVPKGKGKGNLKNKNKSQNKTEDSQNFLPFANLTTLYNYRPTRKVIQIGVLSSFGLFGEEELFYKTNRQMTIEVNSLEAYFYQIQFQKVLEIIGNKLVDRFLALLQKSISKKVLYRQEQFADQISFQNQSNMNYFYIDKEKEKESPKRIKLEKINQKLTYKMGKDNSDHAPPTFTTLNFNKMHHKKHANSERAELNPRRKDDEHESSSESLNSVTYNKEQQKMVGLSHTWNTIEKQVRQQRYVSFKISPFRQSINIQEPLFDTRFFSEVAKEHRRINKQFRTRRFSLAKTKRN